MDELTRAALWYADDGVIKDSVLGGIKALRECNRISLDNCKIVSQEFGWKSQDISLENSEIEAEYLFLDCKNISLKNVQMKGKYSFQYIENLTLENCKISGTQPLCYCKGLKLINCTMEGADLAFEYSDVEADVKGDVISIKNPKSGTIVVDSVGEIIWDDPVMPCNGVVKTR